MYHNYIYNNLLAEAICCLQTSNVAGSKVMVADTCIYIIIIYTKAPFTRIRLLKTQLFNNLVYTKRFH